MLSDIWQNPFTSTVGAAGAIVGIAHAVGITLPIDATTVNTALVVLLGLFAKDANAKS